MANLVLPSKYAEALFSLAKDAGKLAEIKNELLSVKKVFDGNERLKDIVYHPGINKEEKKQILTKVFGAGLSKIVMNFLMLLVDKKRERLIPQICSMFAEKADAEAGIRKITVETAFPLDAAEKEKLKERLEKAMKAKLVMDTRVNEGMLGGIIIKERMRLIDASVVQFLRSMKEDLRVMKVTAVKMQKSGKQKKKINVKKSSNKQAKKKK